MILDMFKRLVNIKTLKKEQATPSMTRKIGMHTSTSGLDPLKAARLLRAAEEGDTVAYLGIAEEMEEKYLHYAAQLATRKRAVASLKPEVIPASSSTRDCDIADFVRAQIPVIHAATFDMMDALGKGFSVCEILWDTTGKQWIPQELVWRDPRWFQFDKADGKTLRLKSDHDREGEPLLPGHYLIHKTRAKSGLPIRSGLARSAIWAFLFQNFSIREWVTFIEQFGRPLRLGRYDSGAVEAADLDVLFEAVRSLGSDAAAILPRSMNIEFPGVASVRTNADIWRGLAEYLDRQVSKLVLGQTLTAETSESGGGAYSLGKIHNDIRLDILDDDAQALARTINRDLIPILVHLNFAGVDALPEYTLRVEYPEDLTAKIAVVEKAVAMGQPVPVQWVSDTFGIPLPEDGEAILGNQRPTGREQVSEEGDGGENRAASGSEKYDAGLINAYSMGVDRLARLGVDIPVSHIREIFSLPAPKAGEAMLVPPSPTDTAAMRLADDSLIKAAHKTASPPGQDLIAQSVDRLDTAAAPEIRKWLETIEVMLDEAESLEHFQAMLLAAYPKISHEALAATLSDAAVALHLVGRAEGGT